MGLPGHSDGPGFSRPEEAKELLLSARPTANRSPQANAATLEQELAQLDHLKADFDQVAEQRAKHLVEAHERFGQFVEKKRYQVVYPVLPMDVLGLYVLLPEGRA